LLACDDPSVVYDPARNTPTLMALMPVCPVIVPLLVIPPMKVATPDRVSKPTPMPADPAEIVPILITPPANVDTLLRSMPEAPAAILPVLVMPPPPAELPKTATLPTRIPALFVADRRPELVRPPAKVVSPNILMALPPAEIVPDFLDRR
jgi:hypothetical protein